jgi:protein SCO1/2
MAEATVQKPEQPAPPPEQPLPFSPKLLVFAALALAIPLGSLILSRPDKPKLPVLAELPAFELTDQASHPFGRKEMLGRVWITNFIFTSCAEACPRLTTKIKGIQDQLTQQEKAATIGLLSISVDPDRDTPAKLHEYAGSFGVDERVWRFLTGPQTEVERTVVRGFRVAMAKVKAEPGSGQAAASALRAEDDPKKIHMEAFDIVHGEQLVLVDVQGRIRGYYTADEPGTKKLLHDARLLATGGA